VRASASEACPSTRVARRWASMDRRAAVLAVISGALVALGAYVVVHQPTAGQVAAQAIERGMARAGTPAADREALEDELLTGDANEAGYRWAERRGLPMRADCPTYSKAFRDGCVTFIEDQGQPDP
jgi:hypothetical protein